MTRITIVILALALAGCATNRKEQIRKADHEANLWFCEQLIGKPCTNEKGASK